MASVLDGCCTTGSNQLGLLLLVVAYQLIQIMADSVLVSKWLAADKLALA
jgi:hypothetical protein